MIVLRILHASIYLFVSYKDFFEKFHIVLNIIGIFNLRTKKILITF